MNVTVEKLVAIGLPQAAAEKFLAEGGTIGGLRLMSNVEIVEDFGVSKHAARSILAAANEYAEAAKRAAEQAPKVDAVAEAIGRAASAVAGALPPNLDILTPGQLWTMYQTQPSEAVLRRMEQSGTRRGKVFPLWVSKLGQVDPELTDAHWTSLARKTFIPSRGHKFRGYRCLTLKQAMQVREWASPMLRDGKPEPLQDQGDGRLLDSAGVNWAPIMPRVGNGRAVWLRLAQMDRVAQMWEGIELVPEGTNRSRVNMLKGTGVIDEDSDAHPLLACYEDCKLNYPSLVAEAEAALEIIGDEEEVGGSDTPFSDPRRAIRRVS